MQSEIPVASLTMFCTAQGCRFQPVGSNVRRVLESSQLLLGVVTSINALITAHPTGPTSCAVFGSWTALTPFNPALDA